MQREGLFREMKNRRAFEKPSERRAREAESTRRVRKLMRKRMDVKGIRNIILKLGNITIIYNTLHLIMRCFLCKYIFK